MKKLTKEIFIEKAQQAHGDNKYDYSKVNYINNKTKVCIICPEHGEFWQTPSNHLQGKGCPECGKIKQGFKRRLDFNNFLKSANLLHNKLQLNIRVNNILKLLILVVKVLKWH